MFPAILILTIMTVPIVSSLTREIFATVPSTAKEGALALGAHPLGDDQDVVLPTRGRGSSARSSSGSGVRSVRRSP